MECDELVNDFAQFAATEIPDEVFRRHIFDRPLLSEEAWRYYLPAWLVRCVEAKGPRFPDEANELVQAFDYEPPQGAEARFTREQWNAIYKSLEHAAQFADAFDREDLVRVLRRVEHEF
ncbi:MAG: hypothetical protein HYX47_07890 [Burkholderiales bacterium]|nr:hypothetical protein [Burkholderiales bacterium]